MPSGDKFVLDACALLRFVQDEPGADRVHAFLNRARAGTCRVMMHIINFGEVVYTIGKEHGWEEAQRERGEMSLLPVEIVPFTEQIFWKAVELKSQYAMSYADCFAAAVAIRESATLLTSDPEFAAVQKLVKRQHV